MMHWAKCVMLKKSTTAQDWSDMQREEWQLVSRNHTNTQKDVPTLGSLLLWPLYQWVRSAIGTSLRTKSTFVGFLFVSLSILFRFQCTVLVTKTWCRAVSLFRAHGAPPAAAHCQRQLQVRLISLQRSPSIRMFVWHTSAPSPQKWANTQHSVCL